jgi:hypothetical protein
MQQKVKNPKVINSLQRVCCWDCNTPVQHKNLKKHVEKINFIEKKWQKCDYEINSIPRNKKEMIEKIAIKRNQVLTTFEKHKDEIHDEVDPPGLTALSQLFDVRLWPSLDSKESSKEIKKQLIDKIKDAEDFFIGEDLAILASEVGQVVDFIFEKKLLSKLQNNDTITRQWKDILPHPSIKDCSTFYNCCYRVTTLPNSEAGCEQSNSKYNRAKNKYSSVMSVDMIQTRMRVGSNGPPIHLFDAESIRIYWRANGHRLAQKIDPQADPNSKVVKRIRKEQNENYTSNIFTKTSKQFQNKFMPY